MKEEKSSIGEFVLREKNIGEQLWLLLFVMAPFCNGYNDKMPLILCAVFFSLWYFFKIKEGISFDGIWLSLGMLTLWTLFGFAYGSNRYEIIFAAVGWWLLFLFYGAVKKYFQKNLQQRGQLYLFVLFLTALMLALYNFYIYIAHCWGYTAYRFQSGIEYSNTLAAFLCIGLFVGLYFFRKATRFRQKVALGFGALFLFVAFLFTYSRMMWLIGCFFLLLYVLYLWREQLTKKRLAIFFCCLGGGFLLLFLMDSLLSLGFTQRILSISLSSTELNERFAYYHDSLRILAAHPLGGLGSGGWDSCLFQYQSGVYITRYPHSFLAQSAVDGGIVALLLMVFVVIYPFIKARKTIFSNDMGVFCFLLNFALIFHGLLDFDFQFPVILMVFLANQAILLVLAEKEPRILSKKSCGILRYVVLLVLPLLVYVAAVEGIFTLGNAAYENGNYKQAVIWFEKGDSLENYHSEMAYKNGEARREYAPQKEREQIEECLAKSIVLDQGNPKYYRFLGDYYLSLGAYGKAVIAYDTLIDLQPILRKNYDRYEKALHLYIKKAEQAGNLKSVKEGKQRLSEIPSRKEKAKEQYSFWTFRLNHLPEI